MWVERCGPDEVLFDGGRDIGRFSIESGELLSRFPTEEDTDHRFGGEAECDLCLVGGSETPLCAYSLAGQFKWRQDEIYGFDCITILPRSRRIYFSGPDTRPHSGVILCDSDSGEILQAPVDRDDRRLIVNRYCGMNSNLVMDVFVETQAGRRALELNRTDSRERKLFWGPSSIVGHVFAEHSALIGDIEGTLWYASIEHGVIPLTGVALGEKVAIGALGIDPRSGHFLAALRVMDRIESVIFEIDADGRVLGEVGKVPAYLDGVFAGDDRMVVNTEGEVWDVRLGRKIRDLDISKLEN